MLQTSVYKEKIRNFKFDEIISSKITYILVDIIPTQSLPKKVD